MAAQHDTWRNLGKAGRDIRATDHSTAEIEKRLPRHMGEAEKFPQQGKPVVEAHAGVQSVNVEDGAKPTQHPCDDCGPNEAANAAFNQTTQGPRERANVVAIPGR